MGRRSIDGGSGAALQAAVNSHAWLGVNMVVGRRDTRSDGAVAFSAADSCHSQPNHRRICDQPRVTLQRPPAPGPRAASVTNRIDMPHHHASRHTSCRLANRTHIMHIQRRHFGSSVIHYYRTAASLPPHQGCKKLVKKTSFFLKLTPVKVTSVYASEQELAFIQ